MLRDQVHLHVTSYDAGPEMVTKEKDDELALFLELRRRPPQSDVASGANNIISTHNNMNNSFGGSSPISKLVLASTMPTRKTAAERFLDSENDKSDYDWLITPPGTPLFPSSEMESQKSMMSQCGMSNARATALTSRLANILEEPGSKTNPVTKRMTVPSGLNASTIGIRRPSSSGGQKFAPRPATPTGRPTLPVSAKTSRSSTPTSRATLPSSKPAAAALRSSTPTRASARSSTPTRTAARPSTPTARPSLSASRSASRPATPTRQQPTTSGAPSASAPRGRSSSVTKSVPTTSKNLAASRGSSPTVKSRPWKPNEIPGFSLDAPPNLRTSLPERPASATRSRPGERSASTSRNRPGERSASTSRSRPAGATAAALPSSAEAASAARRRQQSCSPSRGRVSNGRASGNRISVPSRRKETANGSDDVNPVLMGTRMVERVVNMRKLAPPKQDDALSALSNSYGKSSSLDSGFGRSLSKKSLDMALRHMDIRRSISGNIRSLVTSVPASSMYSVRSGGSGSTKSRTISVPDSPLATCSNASSEPSVNNNSFFADTIEVENYAGSERGSSSPSSQHGGR